VSSLRLAERHKHLLLGLRAADGEREREKWLKEALKEVRRVEAETGQSFWRRGYCGAWRFKPPKKEGEK